MNFAKINHWLNVGNRHSCGLVSAHYCIHINRSDFPSHDCPRFTYPVQIDLDYKDGELLSDQQIGQLVEFANGVLSNKQPTLIHCQAGACRSPTIAGFVLAVVDGLHPIDALAAVEKAIYDQLERDEGGKMCNIVYYPKKQLVRVIESLRKKS